MYKKVTLALENAEKNYIDLNNYENSNLKLPKHIIALTSLFESFIYYGFAVSQIADAIKELDEDSSLFEALIEPHLKVVDDVDMIARQYTPMYVQYIAKIAQGIKSKEAIEKLFG